MPDEKHLRPATREELVSALQYALAHRRGSKTHRHAQDAMTRIAADVLVEHLELAGFVVMKKPEAPQYGWPAPNPHLTE